MFSKFWKVIGLNMFKISITMSNEYQDMLRRREATDYIDWTFGVEKQQIT